eukprot:TRINITY_DN1988_c0_g1_i1.p1 TRINITY_DN1988_c0_g1~~TRINITY_DN1988_c0_g1_i1.p1  ORF type:complete len:166 (-),score=5.84 TRINITY_DN1988_c0_g1_i1:359-856(-)
MLTILRTLLLFCMISNSLGADNWVYLVSYSAAECASDKWISYVSVKRGDGCVANAESFLKFDCTTLKAQTCSDSKCSTCSSSFIYDFSPSKQCYQPDSRYSHWTKAFCGDVSSPYPGAAQIQLRQYNTGNWQNCTSPMNFAYGYPSSCVKSKATLIIELSISDRF